VGDVTLYKKAIGYGLLDFAEELNYGIELSTIKSGYPEILKTRSPRLPHGSRGDLL
jgi:hypothetical protein